MLIKNVNSTILTLTFGLKYHHLMKADIIMQVVVLEISLSMCFVGYQMQLRNMLTLLKDTTTKQRKIGS